MSILDKDLEEKTEEICYERQRSQIEKFASDHMSARFVDQIIPWSTPSADATSFNYKYAYKNYVKCSYPILDEISLRLVRDNDYHLYPFIIHDYDGEYLPDFIKFVVSDDDKIYADRMNSIRIYLDNCPNLKPRKDETEMIVFIRLS